MDKTIKVCIGLLLTLLLILAIAVSCAPPGEVVGSGSNQGSPDACERLSSTGLHYWYRCIDKENHFLCYLYGDVMKCFDVSINK